MDARVRGRGGGREGRQDKDKYSVTQTVAVVVDRIYKTPDWKFPLGLGGYCRKEASLKSVFLIKNCYVRTAEVQTNQARWWLMA